MSYDDALWYGSVMVALAAVNGIVINHYFMAGFHNGMKLRVAVCNLIYKKSLRLSQTALGDTAPGKVVNLLSNDVNRFDVVSIVINSMWAAPLMTFIAGILLWQEVQWAGMFGLAIVFIVVPLQSKFEQISFFFCFCEPKRTSHFQAILENCRRNSVSKRLSERTNEFASWTKSYLAFK